jgi:hypothetical protein
LNDRKVLHLNAALSSVLDANHLNVLEVPYLNASISRRIENMNGDGERELMKGIKTSNISLCKLMTSPVFVLLALTKYVPV